MKGPDGMTIKEKMVLWVGVVIIVIITIYPPVQSTVSYQSSSGVSTFRQVVRYKFLFTDSMEKIHRGRLLLQYLAVLIITASIVVILIFARRHTNERLNSQIAELAAANKKLRHKSSELNRSDESLKEHRRQLEQRVKQQSCELAAANEKLHQQIAECSRSKELLAERTTELTATKEKLQHQTTEHRELEEHLNGQISELAAVNEKLQMELKLLQEIGTGNLLEELKSTAQVDEPTDIINPFDPQKLKYLAELAKRLFKG